MIRRSFLALAGGAAASACTAPHPAALTRRWPPIGRIVEVDGLAVHLWEQGSGTPVVLIHGASGNLRDFTFDLAPRLARNHRVIAVDRPGFGYSDRLPSRGWEPARQATHLRRALEMLTDEPPVIVGHSWGAAPALAWALDAPDRTRGVVNLGGAVMPWGGDLSALYGLLASEFTGPPLAHVLAATLSERRIAGLLGDIFAPQAVPEGYADYIAGPLAARPATLRANARDLVNLDRLLTEQSARYESLPVPVEILHGTEDTTVPASLHAQGLHARLPSSRIALLHGVGHMPHHADAAAVEAAVARLA